MTSARKRPRHWVGSIRDFDRHPLDLELEAAAEVDPGLGRELLLEAGLRDLGVGPKLTGDEAVVVGQHFQVGETLLASQAPPSVAAFLPLDEIFDRDVIKAAQAGAHHRY